MAQGVPGRLRSRNFVTIGTTGVVGRQLYAPAAFTPGEIPGTHFQGLSRPQGTWFHRGEPRKKSPVTPPGIDPGTVRLVAQCLNHYTTPGPQDLGKPPVYYRITNQHKSVFQEIFECNWYLSPHYHVNLIQLYFSSYLKITSNLPTATIIMKNVAVEPAIKLKLTIRLHFGNLQHNITQLQT